MFAVRLLHTFVCVRPGLSAVDKVVNYVHCTVDADVDDFQKPLKSDTKLHINMSSAKQNCKNEGFLYAMRVRIQSSH